MSFAHRRDYYAGGLMMLIGGGAALVGSRYQMGSLTRMGPGFFPTALGVLLAVLGIVIAGTAAYTTAPTSEAAAMRPDWRGWLCITGGALLFVALAGHGGLVPATFVCVFIAAMGDRTNTWKEAALLATGVTFFGTLLFSYLLQISIPVFGTM